MNFKRIKKKDLKLLFNDLKESDIADESAGVSFFLLLSIFPLLMSLLSILPMFPVDNMEFLLKEALAKYMPSQSGAYLVETIDSIFNDLNLEVLSIGFLSALWLSSKGIGALIKSVDHIYDSEKSLSFYKVQYTKLILTIAFLVSSTVILAITAYTQSIVLDLESYVAADAPKWIFSGVQSLILFFVFIIVNSITYHLLHLGRDQFRFFLPGSILMATYLVLGKFFFEYYITNFNNYNVIYGSLGSFFILILWIYFTVIVFLIGVHFNIHLCYKNSHESQQSLRLGFTRKQIIIFSVVLILLAARLSLPVVLKTYINYQLAHNLDNYEGSIESLELNFLKSSYTITGLNIRKKDFHKTLPFIAVQKFNVDLPILKAISGNPTALFKLKKGHINLIDSKNNKKDQTGADEKKENWIAMARTLVPFDIGSLDLKDIKLTLRKDSQNPMSEITLISLKTKNILNKEKASPLTIDMTAKGGGTLKVKGVLNYETLNPIDIDLKIENVDLSSFNSLFMNYVPINFTKGEIEIFAELKRNKKMNKGYVKLFIKDLDVIASDQEFESLKHFGFEIGAGLSNFILNLLSKRHFSLKIPIEINKNIPRVKDDYKAWEVIEDLGKNFSLKFENL